ncbi:hypothetical protein EYB45_03285 [Erythrobacteraceae bacterium CFH 75059]|uniref:hypothetical protein n=1 Tax=Qipengyuania thermophila TaxID=2509361 RepID=UPI001020C30F|nr:hypothetical protein [Qipengyuania thermophila]TCD06725.1 hypothetical protein EYB45_03285 [Erythrobacteraceae bacterium CFH 75059]
MGKRRRAKSVSRWPQGHWRRRLPVAAAIAVGAWFGVTGSLANALVRADAGRAHALAPGNGQIAAANAEQMFATRPEADDTSAAAEMARLAIRRDALTPDALTVLAFQAELRGDTALSNRIFAHSTRLSRRELRPQLWAIEQAVSRGDLAGALRHYDIALKVSDTARNTLYPVLANALPEPLVRAGLLARLRPDTVWARSFLDFVAGSGIQPGAAAAFLSEARAAGLEVTKEQREYLVNALFSAGQHDRAWQEYTALRGATPRNRSRDPRFALRTDVRTPLDWQVDADAGTGAAILAEGQVGVVDFAAPPGAGGPVVRQYQYLPPGTYTLEGHFDQLQLGLGSRPFWQLACENGQEIGRVEVPPSAAEATPFAGRLTVSAQCPVQVLTLIVRPVEDIAGVSGRLATAVLRPFGDGSR